MARGFPTNACVSPSIRVIEFDVLPLIWVSRGIDDPVIPRLTNAKNIINIVIDMAVEGFLQLNSLLRLFDRWIGVRVARIRISDTMTGQLGMRIMFRKYDFAWDMKIAAAWKISRPS